MVKVRLDGFREFDRALGQLPKATARNVLRRTLMKAAKPIDDDASARAPFLQGGLQRSVVAGTRLTASQRTGGPKLTANGYRSAAKNSVEVHVGTKLSKGIFMEFGTFKDAAQPFMTPAWEANKNHALDIIKANLKTEIEKSAARLAKKRAKA